MTLAVLLSLSLSAGAQVRVPTETVVLLNLASTPEAQRRERALHDELALVLDGFGLVSLRPENPRFAEAPLPTQLEEVFAIARAEDAAAVVWLTRDASGQVLLELVVQRTGRTLIRSLGAAGGERALALAVRELLATAFLFEASGRQSAPVTALVTELKQHMQPQPQTPPAEPPSWATRVRVDLGVSVGLVGEVGALPHVVANARGARLLGGWLEVGGFAEAAGARGLINAGAAVSWWRIAFGALAVARKDFERFSLGAGLSAGALTLRWTLVDPMQATAGAGWSFRAELLGDVGFLVTPQLLVSLTLGAGWLSHRVLVSQDDLVLYGSPSGVGRASLGVEYRF